MSKNLVLQLKVAIDLRELRLAATVSRTHAEIEFDMRRTEFDQSIIAEYEQAVAIREGMNEMNPAYDDYDNMVSETYLRMCRLAAVYEVAE